MIWVLVSWHLHRCPLDPHFVAQARPELSKLVVQGRLSVLSSLLLASIFTCQQLCPEGTCLHLGPLQCCLTPHNYCEDDGVYMHVALDLLALNLGSGLFFKRENIGQSWFLCECLRPFIVTNHVIHHNGFVWFWTHTCLCFSNSTHISHVYVYGLCALCWGLKLVKRNWF